MTQLKNITALIIYPILIIAFCLVALEFNKEETVTYVEAKSPIALSSVSESEAIESKVKIMSHEVSDTKEEKDIVQLIRNIQILSKEINKLKD